MAENNNKCARDACSCTVADGVNYCSDHCKKADDQDIIEIKCDCGHSGC